VSLYTRFEKHKALNFENFVSFGDACSGGGNAQMVITCYEEQYLLGLLSFIQNQLKLFDISCTKMFMNSQTTYNIFVTTE